MAMTHAAVTIMATKRTEEALGCQPGLLILGTPFASWNLLPCPSTHVMLLSATAGGSLLRGIGFAPTNEIWRHTGLALRRVLINYLARSGMQWWLPEALVSSICGSTRCASFKMTLRIGSTKPREWNKSSAPPTAPLEPARPIPRPRVSSRRDSPGLVSVSASRSRARRTQTTGHSETRSCTFAQLSMISPEMSKTATSAVVGGHFKNVHFLVVPSSIHQRRCIGSAVLVCIARRWPACKSRPLSFFFLFFLSFSFLPSTLSLSLSLSLFSPVNDH